MIFITCVELLKFFIWIESMLTYGSKTLINDQKECCSTFSFQNLSNHENHEVRDKLELYVCKDWKKKNYGLKFALTTL